jgi:hypothetical protein
MVKEGIYNSAIYYFYTQVYASTANAAQCYVACLLSYT